MAKRILRAKAKAADGKTKVKLMAKHDMETGLRKDKKTGEIIPAVFLKELVVIHKGREVFIANIGTSVSKNPYFSFSFAGGAKGDELSMTWIENTGKTAIETAKIR